MTRHKRQRALWLELTAVELHLRAVEQAFSGDEAAVALLDQLHR